MPDTAGQSDQCRILFYEPLGEYGYLSNFYRCSFELDGFIWPTVEHYFQASKCTSPAERERVRSLKSPGAAKRVGRTLKITPRWRSRQEQIMYEALLAKFSDPKLGWRLFNTGHAQLVSTAPGDYYWGIGSDGTGENRLGILMTKLRYQIGNIIGFYSSFH